MPDTVELPALDDPIVALSTGRQPAPLAIVRLTGVGSFDLAAGLGALPPTATGGSTAMTRAVLRIDDSLRLPADLLWFRAPRSYTAQDLVELHTLGCLPAVQRLCDRLAALGARPAVPGEFTARAYLNGRLDADQVAGVLELINASDGRAARAAARSVRQSHAQQRAAIENRLLDLLARVEAGIDFVDEEDVRFITADELLRELDDILAHLDALQSDARASPSSGMPHVAIAGRPNAGKSTLFNTLLRSTRAIVSPAPGTTRDVLSAQVDLDGAAFVIQDCAGLDASHDDLSTAAHSAARRCIQNADLVLWLHDAAQPWTDQERREAAKLDPARTILVFSKCDRDFPVAMEPPPNSVEHLERSTAAETGALPRMGHRPDTSRPGAIPETLPQFSGALPISALKQLGLADLAGLIRSRLERHHFGPDTGSRNTISGALADELLHLRDLVCKCFCENDLYEMIAFHLRSATSIISRTQYRDMNELVLNNIFSHFCIGK
jgi:tRNA modification GTPase